MTKRPMLIFNGKPQRWFEWLRVTQRWHRTGKYVSVVEWDLTSWYQVGVSYSTRPSGRRVIWVSTEVDDGEKD